MHRLAALQITEPAQVLVSVVPDSLAINLGESAQLNASSNYAAATYNWNPSSGLSCADCSNPTVTLYIRLPTA
ncbi:MAG: hypothetical protein IPH78_09170 [Bacteroidetes bacterium]|nr:hypothetical protein [Bacteroidota bacterium]